MSWWGAGYAVAQDRLGEMELFKRRGSGRLAEILGKSSLEDDVVARRDFYTAAELRRQFARLPKRFRKRTLAYVAGVNAWIAHVRRTPADLPPEFSTLNVPLKRWGLLDTLRIGVLLARTIPSGDGNELENLRALRALGPKKFAELLPLSVPGEITTIPAGAGTFPSVPGRTPAEARAAYARSRKWLKRLPLPSASSARGGERAHRQGAPGTGDRRGPRPRARLVHVGDPAAVRPPHVLLQRPAARLPGARTRSWSST